MTTATDAVTLDEWRSRRHAEIVQFVQDWLRHQDAKPQNWPNKMSIGDWDDQFSTYLFLGGRND